MPWIDRLAILGGVVMLLETLFGLVLVAGLGPPRPGDIAVAVVLLGGLPAYLLDVWSKSRILIALPALFALRLLILDWWRFNELLIPAAILLQCWKLRSMKGSAAR